jgi:phosphoglycerate kinase
MPKLTLDDIQVRGRRVLVRVDFNVPLTDAGDGPAVADDTRIRAALPTIREIIEGGGKAILMSHLGRPGGKPDPDLSLAAVAEHLEEVMGERVRFSSNTVGESVEEIVRGMSDGGVLLLENTRFEAGEKGNDEAFAKGLAALADVYVNDAFGTAHRAHASTVGVTHHVAESAMGRLFEAEVEALTAARDDPKDPLVVVLGGAKVSDKVGVVRNLAAKAKHVLVGGAMAYTFLKAQGADVGGSRVEEGRLERAAEILDAFGDTIQLPEDHVVAAEIDADAATEVASGAVPEGMMGLDIGPKTVERYQGLIAEAGSIIWNGPMGVFEMAPFAAGTTAVAEAVAARTDDGAYSVAGGGDSVAAIQQAGLAERISHVSTGGGAMLTLLEGSDLPGYNALTDA